LGFLRGFVEGIAFYRTHKSNIGKEAARQLAVRFGSRLFPIGLHQAAKKKTDGVYISVKNGGTMIEYEDEDTEIRRRFETNLARVGTPLRMPL